MALQECWNGFCGYNGVWFGGIIIDLGGNLSAESGMSHCSAYAGIRKRGGHISPSSKTSSTLANRS